MDDMDMMWSGSDTPPLIEEEKQTADYFPLLDCTLNGDKNPFLSSGIVSTILSDQQSKRISNVSTPLILFGRYFSSKSLYISGERDDLMNYIRSSIFKVMKLSSHGFYKSHQESTDLKLRKDITKIMYLCYDLVIKSNSSEPILDLIKDIGSLLLSLGNMTDISRKYSVHKVYKNSNIYALFHIHYEINIHYFMLNTLVLLKYPRIVLNQTNFLQVANSMIKDLMTFLSGNFEKSGFNENSGIKDNSFICPCLKELWTILIQIIDYVSKKFASQSFWSIVSNQLQTNSNDCDDNEDSSANLHEFSINFKLFLLCQLAPLYWIDMSGNNTYNEKFSVARNWQLVQEIIQINVSSDLKMDESNLKAVILSCISLSKHWDFSLSIFNLIWNNVFKEINVVTKRDTQTLNTYFKPSFSLSDKMNLYESSTKENSMVEDKKDVFSLFLTYLVASCKKLQIMKDTNQLSQVKGRLYSKFHKKSMNEMSPSGLERFTSIFTTLSFIFNIEEIPKKMCSLISLLQFNQQLMESRKKIITHLFLSVFVCKKLNISSENIIQKLISLFTDLVSLLYETKKKKDLFFQCWDLICYYLTCVEQCLDDNIITQGENLLVCSIYSNLMKTINESLKMHVFSHFKHILLSSYTQHPEFRENGGYDLIWKNIYLPLSELIITEVNSSQLADIIASISILTVERTPDNYEKFDMLVNKYGFSNNTPLSFRYIYLSYILSSSSALERLIKMDRNNVLIKEWINSVIMDLHKSPTVIELTRSIISSSKITNWPVKFECESVENVENILIQYISFLGKQYNSIQLLADMSNFRKMLNEIFSGLIQVAENIIFTKNCEKSTLILVKVAAKLVECCAKAIYSKTSPACLLPKILDLFVLPLQSGKKPTSLLLAKLLKQYIHHFLIGLASLDLKNDNFLCRKIKDIIQKYFMELTSQVYTDSKKNPFFISLGGSCVANPTKPARFYRQILLECIKDRFLVLPQAPDKLVVVLNFILKVIRSTMCKEENKSTMKLLSMKMVSCVLICDAVQEKGEPKGIRKLAMDILRKMLSQSDNGPSNEVFKELLYKFICDNINHYNSILFKTMQGICVLCPTVIKALLSDIEILIGNHEKKRGVGVDHALRTAFAELKSCSDRMCLS